MIQSDGPASNSLGEEKHILQPCLGQHVILFEVLSDGISEEVWGDL